MRGNRVSPDKHELNSLFGERAQYVSEVGVQQLPLLLNAHASIASCHIISSR